MAPPPKTEYRYDPEQDTSTFGSVISPIIGGPRRYEAEERRRALQDQAVVIIEESLAGAEANINMAGLVPQVMRAVNEASTLSPADGSKFIDEVKKTIRAPFGLDAADDRRQADVISRLTFGGTPKPTPSTPGTKSGGSKTQAERLGDLRNRVLEAADLVANAKTPEERATAETSLYTLSGVYKQVADLADGQVTLKDGTIITSAMLNNADPAVAAQYQQAFADRATAIENENNATLNAYNIEGYNLGRQSVADQNSTAIAQYNAAAASIRDRLSRDEIDVTRATAELNRALQGLQESRSRTDLETKTAENAAPWATTNGKTSFSANDLGDWAVQMQRNSGGDPNAAIIKFPGVITLDPSAAMAKRDAELGVTGALPQIPKSLSVTDADIPRAPALINPGSIQLPERIAPKPRQVITMPGSTQNDYNVPVPYGYYDNNVPVPPGRP
jgi:hypothetical protein